MSRKTAKTSSKKSASKPPSRPKGKPAGREAVLQKTMPAGKPAKSQGRRHVAGTPRGTPPPRGASPPWSRAEIEEAFRRLQVAKPEPKGELLHINAFTLLVAVVLSAQATDAGVNKATPAL